MKKCNEAAWRASFWYLPGSIHTQMKARMDGRVGLEEHVDALLSKQWVFQCSRCVPGPYSGAAASIAEMLSAWKKCFTMRMSYDTLLAIEEFSLLLLRNAHCL